MLKQHGGEPRLRDGPEVFGKPWFWQRNGGAVDGSRGLACVLVEMRDEIKKLEAENRQLRADCRQLSSGEDPEEAEQQPEENPYLRRNASAPVLKGQSQGRPQHRLLENGALQRTALAPFGELHHKLHLSNNSVFLHIPLFLPIISHL